MKPKIEISSRGSDSTFSSIGRLVVAAGIAVLLLAASASTAAGSVTIGQLAPGTPTGFGDPSGTVDIAQRSVTSGNGYAVPGAGTITSWSHNAATGAGQQLTFKVFRHVTETTYTVVGHDGPRSITGGEVNTFPASIPVRPGDIIGFHWNLVVPAEAAFFEVAEETAFSYLSRDGNLADGESGVFDAGPGRRVNATAVFVPTNLFSLGKVKRNTKKGTATLTVDVPNPGDLSASGKGVKAAGAGAVISKAVTAPGTVKLLIKAKGKQRKKLNETGKVKLKPKITYIPTGGDPRTQSTKLKLRKN